MNFKRSSSRQYKIVTFYLHWYAGLYPVIKCYVTDLTDSTVSLKSGNLFLARLFENMVDNSRLGVQSYFEAIKFLSNLTFYHYTY